MILGTQTEYARYRGCSKQNIGKLKSRLVFVDGKVDFEASDRALKDTLDPGLGGDRTLPAPVGPSQGSFLDAKTTVTEFQAKKAALDWAQTVGLVVDRASVERENQGIARKIRERVMRVARDGAGRVAALADERECRAVLAELIEAALTDVANLLDQPDEDEDIDLAAE